MTKPQRLFLIQARSAYQVFRLLRATAELHHCHALHYLQMATELLGKADAWRIGYPGDTHRAIVPFLRRLSSNRAAKMRLGYTGHTEQWEAVLRKALQLADRLERLAPAMAGDGPNPEYPWPKTDPRTAPVEHDFDVWADLSDTHAGRQLLDLFDGLFQHAEEIL